MYTPRPDLVFAFGPNLCSFLLAPRSPLGPFPPNGHDAVPRLDMTAFSTNTISNIISTTTSQSTNPQPPTRQNPPTKHPNTRTPLPATSIIPHLPPSLHYLPPKPTHVSIPLPLVDGTAINFHIGCEHRNSAQPHPHGVGTGTWAEPRWGEPTRAMREHVLERLTGVGLESRRYARAGVRGERCSCLGGGPRILHSISHFSYAPTAASQSAVHLATLTQHVLIRDSAPPPRPNPDPAPLSPPSFFPKPP